MYDYLIVGAGLYGCVWAEQAAKKGKNCLIIDKRPHIGGNVYTENLEDINVHKYGAHIFHTNDREVWDYITEFAEFNRYTNSPVANYKGEIYNLPFNMNTFNKMWGVITPDEAKAKIEEQKKAALAGLAGVTDEDSPEEAEAKINSFVPSNLEEQAISLVGVDIYEKLVNGYTEKQWGRSCRELPSFIIKRLPVRFTYDNNYFNALFQGIPTGGYTKLVENILGDFTLLDNIKSIPSAASDSLKQDFCSDCAADAAAAVQRGNIQVCLNTDFFENRDFLKGLAAKMIFTGPIDAYFEYSLGALKYRSVRFETETLDTENYQGNAVVNYTDRETPFTRIIEHKHFEFARDEHGDSIPKTIISREYSAEWHPGDEPYYPVNDDENAALYQKYRALAEKEDNVIFGGRLGEYKYYDMDQVIKSALISAANELS